MERVDYYRKLREILCRDMSIDVSMMFSPSLIELSSGALKGGLIDLGELLPRLSSEQLEEILIRLARTDQKVVAIVSFHHSDELTASGSNIHATVQPPDWWKAIFARHFAQSDFVKPHRASELVWTNFRVSQNARSEIDALGRVSSVRRELTRFVSRAKLACRVLTGRCVSRRELFDELRGKRVAVVGNARSLDQCDLGPEIDAHDMVIRFNRVPIVSTKSHGSRTTWVATGVPITQQRISSLGASHVLWLSRHRRKIPSETAGVDRLYLHPIRELDSLAERSCVQRPTTGLAAIDLLSSSDVEQVTIYGFDFFRSQSSSSHQTIEIAPHQFDQEEQFVKELIEKDARFIIRRSEQP